MSVNERRSEREDIQLSIKEAKSRLDRLERHEWWRWGLAFLVMLALTAGLFAMSVPVGGSAPDALQLSIGLRALLGLVLLFDVFVVHQQFLIKKLRRELATQLGVISAFESLQDTEEKPGIHVERRRVRRSGLDRRLRVNTIAQGKPTPVYGRIRDICEDGLGAVIPCSLHIGQQVTLEFCIENARECSVEAIVRHRRSFHYGFEFIRIDADLRQAICRFVEEPAVS